MVHFGRVSKPIKTGRHLPSITVILLTKRPHSGAVGWRWQRQPHPPLRCPPVRVVRPQRALVHRLLLLQEEVLLLFGRAKNVLIQLKLLGHGSRPNVNNSNDCLAAVAD